MTMTDIVLTPQVVEEVVRRTSIIQERISKNGAPGLCLVVLRQDGSVLEALTFGKLSDEELERYLVLAHEWALDCFKNGRENPWGGCIYFDIVVGVAGLPDAENIAVGRAIANSLHRALNIAR